MTRLDVSIMIANNRLFSGLPGPALASIAKLTARRRAARGATLFFQGDAGDVFYGIESGRVRISTMSEEGRELHLVELGPGDTFGEIALLDGGPRTASALVTDAASLFVIERRAFRSLLERDVSLAIKLLERLCERVRWTSELVEDLSFLRVEAQIAKRIWLLARNFGTDSPDGRQLRVAQGDLATFLGLSRQAVNTHLQAWRAEGWLEISRGRLLIRDPGRLEQVFEVS
jgi:CRP-like cAMP-binding protein